jgi:hypothetical protein
MPRRVERSDTHHKKDKTKKDKTKKDKTKKDKTMTQPDRFHPEGSGGRWVSQSAQPIGGLSLLREGNGPGTRPASMLVA